MRRSVVLLAVVVAVVCLGAVIATAAFRHAKKNQLPSPFVVDAERPALTEIDQDARDREEKQRVVDAWSAGQAEAQARVEAEREQQSFTQKQQNPRVAGQADDGGIPLPPGGIHVVADRSAGQQSAQQPQGQQPATTGATAQAPQQQQVPYNDGEAFNGGYGFPFTVSDFTQGAPSAPTTPNQVVSSVPNPPPSGNQPVVQAQPPVQETPVGGAANSAPAPGASAPPR